MFWKCKCGRTPSNTMKQCRNCGSPKSEIAIETTVDGVPRMTPLKDLEKQGKVKHEKNNRKKLANLPDPEKGKYYISTYKPKNQK